MKTKIKKIRLITSTVLLAAIVVGCNSGGSSNSSGSSSINNTNALKASSTDTNALKASSTDLMSYHNLQNTYDQNIYVGYGYDPVNNIVIPLPEYKANRMQENGKSGLLRTPVTYDSFTNFNSQIISNSEENQYAIAAGSSIGVGFIHAALNAELASTKGVVDNSASLQQYVGMLFYREYTNNKK